MSAAPRASERSAEEARIWSLLAEVNDPEIPVLSVVDLGMVREVSVGAATEIILTPTYVGCPATDVITLMVREHLERNGVDPEIKIKLSPPWTTDWLSEEGRRKLADYGIAPPVGNAGGKRALFGEDPVVACPRCGSETTEKVSEFGSTPCKAHYRCRDCLEPFDYFKCL